MNSVSPCRTCGAPVAAENQFCTGCGTPTTFRPPSAVTDSLGQPQATSAAPPTLSYARRSEPSFAAPSPRTRPVSGIGITPSAGDAGMNGISLAYGEVVKRVYELGRIERLWGVVQGTLVVTDTRVLYHAEAKNKLNRSTLNREIHLKDIRGVGLSTRKGMSAAGLGAWLLGSFLWFSLILAVSGFFDGVSQYSSYGSAGGGANGWGVFLFLFWLVACIAIFLLRRRASVVVLAVFSNEGDSAPISVSGVVGQSGGHGFLARFAGPLIMLLERLGIIEAGAAAESADIESVRAVYAELGAVILDLQSRGTLGAN
jgi:hypothetical protein